jgi:hypothetical protein
MNNKKPCKKKIQYNLNNYNTNDNGYVSWELYSQLKGPPFIT